MVCIQRTGDFSDHWRFRDCDLLETVLVPDTVTRIESYACFHCDRLNDVHLGKTLSSLGNSSFASCGKLVNVYFHGDAPTSVASGVFSSPSSGFAIYYPEGRTGWSTPTWKSYPAYPYVPADSAGVYQINSITLTSDDGTALTVIPKTSFKATVSITNRSVEHEDTVVLLAAYSKSGQFRDWMAVGVEDCPIGATVKIILPIDNSKGDIAVLKAFTISASGSMMPMGDAVVFPA